MEKRKDCGWVSLNKRGVWWDNHRSKSGTNERESKGLTISQIPSLQGFSASSSRHNQIRRTRAQRLQS